MYLNLFILLLLWCACLAQSCGYKLKKIGKKKVKLDLSDIKLQSSSVQKYLQKFSSHHIHHI